MLNVFINIIKPEGMNSSHVVAVVRKKLGKIPCGHMGTLDPMASGVLPVGTNRATRLFDYLLDKNKTYVAHFKFGAETDTLDKTGKITKVTGIFPSKEQILKVLPDFIGEIEQIPPVYSSKCINGKRAYALARRGEEVVLPAKKVTVNSIVLDGQVNEDTYRFTIECKGGTYIRSLCRDIAKACGTVGTMVKLDRIKSGVFSEENGITVQDFIEDADIERYFVSPDTVIDYPKIILTKMQAKRILDGLFDDYGYKDGLYRVYSEDEFWGIGKSENGILKIKSYIR